MDFVIGGLSAAGAAVFTNPIDVLKTRMQLQGELKARGQHAIHYRNVFHAAYVVAKHDGIVGLQKGLGPAIVMHTIRNGLRLGMYQMCYKRGILTDQQGRNLFWRVASCSALCGAFGAFVGSPFFLVKTQLQSATKKAIAVGHQHHHTSTMQAFQEIYIKHGIRGLWRGATGTVLRALTGSSAQLTSFAMMKEVLNEFDTLKNLPVVTALLASIIGGLCQTVMTTPFDIVSVRLYNQGVDAEGKGLLYSGVTDCFIKMWKTEGFLGFYKGVVANYMRLAPHVALTLVFWDILKDLQVKYIG